jgi:soluble lytic murein transglycosylase-like protein
MLGLTGTLLVALVLGIATPRPAAGAGNIYIFTDAGGNLHLSDQPRHRGYKLYRKASKPKKLPRATYSRSLASPNAWDGAIARAARAHRVPPALIKAVVHVESAFNPDAVSRRGAQGLMQLMPATTRKLGVDDPFNPWQNIEGGTKHLSQLVRRYRGDLQLALAAYNAGDRAVERFGGVPPYPETRGYVMRVLALYKQYGRSCEDEDCGPSR